MSKRKHQLIGGWGARTSLTPQQQEQLDTCLTILYTETLKELGMEGEPAVPGDLPES